MKTEYKEENLEYTMEFKVSRRFHNYRGYGKTYPLVTQCVIKNKGFIVGIGNATLHAADEYDELTGNREAFKKASQALCLSIRTGLYNAMMKEHERLQKTN